MPQKRIEGEKSRDCENGFKRRILKYCMLPLVWNPGLNTHTYDIKAKVGLFRKKRKLVVWKRVVRNSNKEVKAGKIQYYVIEIS